MPRLSVFVFLNLVELVAKRCKNHLHVVEYIESGKVLHAGGSFGSLVHAGWVRANKLQHHSHSSSPILTLFSLEIVRTQATRPFSPHSQPRLWMQADKQILCRFLASPNIKQECHLICKKVHSPSILFLSHLNIENTST